jgi:predicted PurR-regulated permease PerM
MVSFELEIDWGRTVWVLFGLLLAGVVLWVVHSFIGTFVFALFIYYSTRRIYWEIRERVGHPSVSAALALLVLALPAVLLVLCATAIGLQELRDFAETADLGPVMDVVGPFLNVSNIVEDPRELLSDGGIDVIRRALVQTTAYLGVVGTGLLHLFVMFAAAFYLLRDDHRMSSWVGALGDEWGIVEEYAVAVDRSLEKVFAGNILNAVVTGTVGAITYSLLNLLATDPVSIPYAALVGLVAGLASLIPVVGMKIVYVPVVVYLAAMAWMEGRGWAFVGLFAGVSFVVVDVIPDLVVRPYVSGGGLHTGSLMFAYILGPLLFGWYGLFLGPVVLVFVMHFGRIVVPELVSARQIRPTGVDPSHLTEPAGTSAGASGGDSTPSTGETAGADSPGDPPTGDDVDPSTD